MVPPIVSEEEEEEDMTTNLRARFKERQHKHLSESIVVNPAPSKRAYPEFVCLKPVLALVPVLTPSTTAISIIPKLGERLF